MDIKKDFEMLTSKDAVQGCGAMDRLCLESTKSPEVYAYMDGFFELLGNKNSYVRNRAVKLIAVNARWDSKDIIKKRLDEFLSHINDEKPITARQCISAAILLGETKKSLIARIICALKEADTAKYADSMRPLVEKDIKYATESLQKNSKSS